MLKTCAGYHGRGWWTRRTGAAAMALGAATGWMSAWGDHPAGIAGREPASAAVTPALAEPFAVGDEVVVTAEVRAADARTIRGCGVSSTSGDSRVAAVGTTNTTITATSCGDSGTSSVLRGRIRARDAPRVLLRHGRPHWSSRYGIEKRLIVRRCIQNGMSKAATAGGVRGRQNRQCTPESNRESLSAPEGTARYGTVREDRWAPRFDPCKKCVRAKLAEPPLSAAGLQPGGEAVRYLWSYVIGRGLRPQTEGETGGISR